MGTQESKMMNDFQLRARPLVESLHGILDEAEEGLDKAPKLKDYARSVEMIQNYSRTLVQLVKDPNHIAHKLQDYSGVCRSIALKIADITENQTLFEVTLALLMDATEVLENMIESLNDDRAKLDAHLNQKLVERLRWASYQFQGRGHAVSGDQNAKLDQNDIDDLLKKLGVA